MYNKTPVWGDMYIHTVCLQALGMILMETSRSIGRYNDLESVCCGGRLLCAIKTYRRTTDMAPLAVETVLLGMILVEISRSIGRYNNFESGCWGDRTAVRDENISMHDRHVVACCGDSARHDTHGNISEYWPQ